MYNFSVIFFWQNAFLASNGYCNGATESDWKQWKFDYGDQLDRKKANQEILKKWNNKEALQQRLTRRTKHFSHVIRHNSFTRNILQGTLWIRKEGEYNRGKEDDDRGCDVDSGLPKLYGIEEDCRKRRRAAPASLEDDDDKSNIQKSARRVLEEAL